MTKSKYKPKHSWYQADMRRRAIAKEKKLKAARYIEEMNKRANEQSVTPSVL